MRYPVVLHTDNGVSFGVTVPDVPGCFSAGDDLEEALTMAVEAITFHIETLVEDGEPIPVPNPNSLAEHRGNEDYADGIWTFVDVDLTRFNK